MKYAITIAALLALGCALLPQTSVAQQDQTTTAPAATPTLNAFGSPSPMESASPTANPMATATAAPGEMGAQTPAGGGGGGGSWGLLGLLGLLGLIGLRGRTAT
jgi:hypothetical protein